jgi:hypothetical protein
VYQYCLLADHRFPKNSKYHHHWIFKNQTPHLLPFYKPLPMSPIQISHGSTRKVDGEHTWETVGFPSSERRCGLLVSAGRGAGGRRLRLEAAWRSSGVARTWRRQRPWPLGERVGGERERSRSWVGSGGTGGAYAPVGAGAGCGGDAGDAGDAWSVELETFRFTCLSPAAASGLFRPATQMVGACMGHWRNVLTGHGKEKQMCNSWRFLFWQRATADVEVPPGRRGRGNRPAGRRRRDEARARDKQPVRLGERGWAPIPAWRRLFLFWPFFFFFSSSLFVVYARPNIRKLVLRLRPDWDGLIGHRIWGGRTARVNLCKT